MDKNILNEPWLIKIGGYVLAQAPAFAGAVMSLAFIGRLSPAGRIVAVIVGAVTAMFIAPAISDFIGIFWPADVLPPSISKAVQFMVSLSAMGALPELLAFIRRASGDPLGVIERFMPAKRPDGEGQRMITVIGGAVGLICVGLIVRVVWRHPDMPLTDKLPLCILAAGLIWGGVNRALGRPFDLGDLIMLIGLAGLIWRFKAAHPKITG